MIDTNGDLYYYLKDHLGSNRVVVREDGFKTNTYSRYLAFGELENSSISVETPFTFTGKPLDEEMNLSLQYFGARYYDDGGRFTQIDPLRNIYPSLSPYVYAKNNPFKYIDPDGRYPYNTNAKEDRWLIKASPRQIWYADQNRTGAELHAGPSEDNINDALRHAIWSAFNARDLGSDVARAIGYNHEVVTNNSSVAVLQRAFMDLYNNEIGILLAEECKNCTQEELLNYIFENEASLQEAVTKEVIDQNTIDILQKTYLSSKVNRSSSSQENGANGKRFEKSQNEKDGYGPAF